MTISRIVIISILVSIAAWSASYAQIATGGSYSLEQQVVAGGGGSSTAPNYAVDGTIGQSTAGGLSVSQNYGIIGGFWQPSLGTTAAHVSAAGQLLASDGRFIGGARVTLTDGAGGSQQRISNPFGYFRFDNIEAGQTYLLTATSKQYVFAARIVNLNDAIDDLRIVAIR